MKCAEVHYCLVEVGGLLRGEELLCECGEVFFAVCGVDGAVDSEVSCEDAEDVAVNDGVGEVEG